MPDALTIVRRQAGLKTRLYVPDRYAERWPMTSRASSSMP
jgi:hypothetical protein